MRRLRVLTVDDEVLALRRIQILLQTIPEVDHVGEASGCMEAAEKIEILRPQVVLLDVKMRDGTGFDVLQSSHGRATPAIFIFITAFEGYAVRAFDSVAIDYLLKPVERSRLVKALEKADANLAVLETQGSVAELKQIIRNLRDGDSEGNAAFEHEFWLRSASGIVKILVDDIECVSSEDEYVAIHTVSGSHLMRGSIRQFLSKVEPGIFARIHRRWLVRKSAIVELCNRSGPTQVVLRSGRRLSAGRVHLRELRRELGRFSMRD